MRHSVRMRRPVSVLNDIGFVLEIPFCCQYFWFCNCSPFRDVYAHEPSTFSNISLNRLQRNSLTLYLHLQLGYRTGVFQALRLIVFWCGELTTYHLYVSSLLDQKNLNDKLWAGHIIDNHFFSYAFEYMHTYTHTHIYTYIHTYIHT